MVVAVPPPDELPDAAELVARAIQEVGEISGPEVTPRLLAKIAELSGGRSLRVNVDLVINNARAAAQTAVAFARLEAQGFYAATANWIALGTPWTFRPMTS